MIELPRTITTHQVNECNSAISIQADAPNPKSSPDDEYRQPTLGEYVWTVITAVCAALLVIAVVLLFSACTPAQRELVGSSTQTAITGVRIAACVQSVLAEEELQRAKERREAEVAAELEAERIREVAREHPGSVSDEVEKVLK